MVGISNKKHIFTLLVGILLLLGAILLIGVPMYEKKLARDARAELEALRPLVDITVEGLDISFFSRGVRVTRLNAVLNAGQSYKTALWLDELSLSGANLALLRDLSSVKGTWARNLTMRELRVESGLGNATAAELSLDEVSGDLGKIVETLGQLQNPEIARDRQKTLLMEAASGIKIGGIKADKLVANEAGGKGFALSLGALDQKDFSLASAGPCKAENLEFKARKELLWQMRTLSFEQINAPIWLFGPEGKLADILKNFPASLDKNIQAKAQEAPFSVSGLKIAGAQIQEPSGVTTFEELNLGLRLDSALAVVFTIKDFASGKLPQEYAQDPTKPMLLNATGNVNLPLTDQPGQNSLLAGDIKLSGLGALYTSVSLAGGSAWRMLLGTETALASLVRIINSSFRISDEGRLLEFLAANRMLPSKEVLKQEILKLQPSIKKPDQQALTDMVLTFLDNQGTLALDLAPAKPASVNDLSVAFVLDPTLLNLKTSYTPMPKTEAAPAK